MVDYFWIWSELIVRWVHVIAGIAWIGSSFYFIALDLSLKPGKELPAQAHGQAWQVHGGGFYNMVKYLVAPARMPDELTWFKWEAYGTWVSGIALMSLVYYGSASFYMIDFEILDINEIQAISISLIGIGLGWACYDGLCRSPIGRNDLWLAVFGFLFLVALAYSYGEIFSARGAFMQMGVTIGTIMVANVLMVIIPGQRKVVVALKAGETPDPQYGVRGKQRSLHNNYLTLPVIFVMIGSHYPMVFATDYAWVILALVLLIGAVIRHFFNTKHSGGAPPWWTWAVAFVLALAAIVLSYIGAPPQGVDNKLSKSQIHRQSVELVIERCSSCHARVPNWDGLVFAPKGVYLETESDVVYHRDAVFWQAAASRAMPPGNLIWFEDNERALLAQWADTIKKSSPQN
mgnify:FL=1